MSTETGRKPTKFVVAAGVALALVGCGSAEPEAENQAPDGPDGSYSVDRESGVTTAEIRTGDGIARMESGALVRANLPDGFTIYPDAEIESVTNIAGDREGGTLVKMNSEASPEQIAEFYRAQAETAGFSIEMDMVVDRGRMLAAKSGDGVGLSLNSRRSEDVTEATLMIGRDPV